MGQAQQRSGVAIIGMACRFPGADDPATFWRKLCEGVESITFFSDDELLAAGEDPELLQSPNYVKTAPILNDVDKFDAAFFEYSPKEAALLDPQQRLFLEVAWETFEDAGYHPDTYQGVVGVFAGGGGVVTSYLLAHADHPALAGQTGSLPHLGNDKDFLSTRVSYKLNLKGPSVTVQTACSTSLVAVHLACQSLLAGECDMVLAGASTVRIPHRRGYLAEKGNIYSFDGHCRPFDAAGQGTIFGSGVAAVLLKRVRDAIADGDHIYALIKATAVNNDGGRKVSYTAPSVVGQARAMVEALTLADVPPESIRYVECHATGTAVGDPLEIQALTTAFGTSRRGFCAVGSVKSNIGHPEQTAGLAGLMKAALALRHRRIPPTLHFVTPNTQIDFANSPFYVNTELRDWPRDPHPRRAAVNSLGMGGTNAFALLEEAPEAPRASDGPDWPAHLFTLSAKSEPALRAYAERFRTFLDGQPEGSLADICYTSNLSRGSFTCRLAVTATSTEDLKHKLAAVAAGSPGVRVSTRRRSTGGIAFLFTGQGAQWPGMAAGLYDAQPHFRETLDQCDALLRPHLEKPLLSVIFARDAGASLLDETAYTQPALFAIEYALAGLWQSWNVVPDALLGHSVGELVAACIAGVMELEDALWLVAERGRLMQSLPKDGAMAAIFAPDEIVERVVGADPDRVAIAALNSPHNTVISGERKAIHDCLEQLKRQGIASKPLAVSHAFHSPLMHPILEVFERAASRIRYNAPHTPLISNVTGKPLDEVPDAHYWREHLRRTVRFAEGVRALGELGCEVFLEMGPGMGLLGLGRQTLPSAMALWLPSLVRDKHDWQTALEALQQLYLEGLAINWQKVHRGQEWGRVPLPTYPFQRKSYWLEGAPRSGTSGQARDPSVHPLLEMRAAASAGEVRFEGVLTLERLPYLSDHRIHGKVVFPTAAGLDAALAAGRAWFGGNDLALENVVYQEALTLDENEPRPVHLILIPLGADKAAFRLLSAAADGGRRTHMTGIVSKAAVGGERSRDGSVEEARVRSPRELPADVYYAAVGQLGIEYGKSFQGIERLWQGDCEAVSQVRLPAGVPADGYALHPAFLDACLHAYPALVPEYGDLSRPGGPRDDVYLPIGMERFRIYRTHVAEAWTHLVLRDGAPGEVLVVDIRVYDQASNLVAVLDGLSLRRLGRDAIVSAGDRQVSDWFYELRWDEQPRSEWKALPGREPTSWLVFADQGGVGSALAELLRRRGDRCHLVVPGLGVSRGGDGRWTLDPARPDDYHRLLREVSALERRPFAGSVYLWTLDVPPLRDMAADELKLEAIGVRGALFLSQALAEARSTGLFTGRLWFVTRNAQHLGAGGAPTEAAQAPVWGLARTVALEHPSLWGGVIDLPPGASSSLRGDADALADELLGSDGEDQVAFRNGKRFVPRLARLALERVPRHPATFRKDATYLITGGLGVLGLRLARWLVEQEGVRFLVLTGRSGAQGQARESVAALEARGARVRVIEADVSVDAEVSRLMDAIRNLPPLRGVFHCAGVLDDGVLSQMDWQRFTRVMAPKVRGSWLLHRYTRDMDLDFFVLQSSFLSLTGAPGQANYTAANAFLDAMVGHRRALGLPAIAINWGPWGEAGMATAAGSRGEAIWRGRGMQYIPPEDGMRVFGPLIRHSINHAVVAITDWSVYLGQFPEPMPLYRELAREVGRQAAARRTEQAGDLRARLRSGPREQQRATLLDVIREHVMRELGFEDAIDPAQPLSELGLDSLMSVNVAQRLEQALGIPVPGVKLIQGPSLERLADDLLADLAGGVDGAAAGSSSVATGRVASPAGNGWLVFPKPNPSVRVRLFCFPYSGGGAMPFRSWADVLHPEIELVAIEPPGHASRIDEPGINRLDTWLEQLGPAIVPYLDKPVAFFGHCLGALTLFETARWLRRHHRLDLAHLFVSGARPPHRVARDGPFEEHLLAMLLKDQRFDPFVPPHEQPDEVFAEMIRHFNIGATEELLANAELRRLLLPAVRADFAMASRYRFTPEPPWDVPVTCFVGLDDPYVTRDDALAWGEYTTVALHLHIRTGAHFLVVDDRAFIVETINRELGG